MTTALLMTDSTKRLTFVLFLLLAGGASVACSGSQTADLPPPEYETPKLPSWQPPQKEPADAFDESALEGEWVDEPAPEAGVGGAGGAPAPGPAGA